MVWWGSTKHSPLRVASASQASVNIILHNNFGAHTERTLTFTLEFIYVYRSHARNKFVPSPLCFKFISVKKKKEFDYQRQIFIDKKAYSRNLYLARRLRATISLGAREEFEEFYSKWFLQRSPVEATTLSGVSTIQKDMVFSQSNIHPHNHLKVVELNNLKPEKVNDTIGNSTGGDPDSSQPLAWTTPSFSEVYLKPEPLFEDAMFNETDCEFFQDLVHWCSDPAKVEPTPIDPPKKREEIFHNTDTLHTTFSPQSWDVLDANSSGQARFYSSTPNDPLSPIMDAAVLDSKFLYSSEVIREEKSQLVDQNLDILNLPVVLGNLASEEMVDLNQCPSLEPINYYNNNTIQNTDYTSTINTHKMFLHINDDEDSLDMKLGSVIMGEVENNDEGIFNMLGRGEPDINTPPRQHLSLNVAATPAVWPGGGGGAISTPEVLSYVEQLEKEKCIPIAVSTPVCSSPDPELITIDSCLKTTVGSSKTYEPESPRSESQEESDADNVKTRNHRRKRFNSEDSDKTYTPYNEDQTTRRNKRRKPNVPIKDMILALEESQQLPKARRGRPPKRRESNISSACSVDDNTSCASSHETKYREIRDKNNEASKRSRMNRKLKELQMEQLVVELEERNKKLQIKADILEDMTKRLKEALMTAIIQKQ